MLEAVVKQKEKSPHELPGHAAPEHKDDHTVVFEAQATSATMMKPESRREIHLSMQGRGRPIRPPSNN